MYLTSNLASILFGTPNPDNLLYNNYTPEQVIHDNVQVIDFKITVN
jgi:hypothetical protein